MKLGIEGQVVMIRGEANTKLKQVWTEWKAAERGRATGLSRSTLYACLGIIPLTCPSFLTCLDGYKAGQVPRKG